MAEQDSIAGMLLDFHAAKIDSYMKSYPSVLVDEVHELLKPCSLEARRIFSLYVENDITNGTSVKYPAYQRMKAFVYMAAAAPVVSAFWRTGKEPLLLLLPNYDPNAKVNAARELESFIARFQKEQLLREVNSGLHRHRIGDDNWASYARGSMLTRIMHPKSMTNEDSRDDVLWLGDNFYDLAPYADVILERGFTDPRFLGGIIGVSAAVAEGVL